jgi:hypothetical protein
MKLFLADLYSPDDELFLGFTHLVADDSNHIVKSCGILHDDKKESSDHLSCPVAKNWTLLRATDSSST